MEDLALYILLTYRIDFNTSVYICEDKKTFIKECWTRIECMESKELATSISAFLERYNCLVCIILSKKSLICKLTFHKFNKYYLLITSMNAYRVQCS